MSPTTNLPPPGTPLPVPLASAVAAESAGRRLDAWVHRVVFGAEVVFVTGRERPPGPLVPWGSPPADDYFEVGRSGTGHPVSLIPVPAYSASFGAAWAVVEWMRAEGWAFTIMGVPSVSSVSCPTVAFARSVYPPNRGKADGASYDPDPAVAACKAAITARLVRGGNIPADVGAGPPAGSVVYPFPSGPLA